MSRETLKQVKDRGVRQFTFSGYGTPEQWRLLNSYAAIAAIAAALEMPFEFQVGFSVQTCEASSNLWTEQKKIILKVKSCFVFTL